jgi:hypothetical protein
MNSLLLTIFFLALLLEGTVTNLPLVFVSLVILTVAMRSLFLFLLAFVSGIFLDAFALRPIGETSIFLLLCVFLILLYQRKYEINSYPFVLFASFVGSLIYLFMFGYVHAFTLAIASIVISFLLFMVYRLQSKNLSANGRHTV